MRYLAFISYRHRDRDRQISAQLRKGLETYRLPARCPLDKKRKVFRDTDELPTSSDLNADIENALRDSQWLIPLCSEEYTRSKWCLREIEDWIGQGRKENILPILISGTPETAMPSCIHDIPPFGDLRNLEGRERKRRTDELISALLSRMSGTDREAITAAERRFRLTRAAGLFTCLTAAVFGFGLYTMRTADLIARNNDSIREATAVALEEKSLALAARNDALIKKAEYYTDRAWEAINADRPLEAIRFALEALPADPYGDKPVSQSAVSALRVALYLPGRTRDDYVLVRSVTPQDTVTGFEGVDVGLSSTHEGADKLILTTRSQTLYELTLSTGEITDCSAPLLTQAHDMGYTRARHITNNGRDTIFYGRENQMLNTRYGTVRYTLNGEPFYADRLIADASGEYLLAWLEDPLPGQEPRAAVFQLPDLKMNVPADGAEALTEIPLNGGILTAVFPHRGNGLAILDREGALRLYDIRTGRLKKELRGNYRFAAELANTSSALFIADAEGNGALIDLITGGEVYRLNSPGKVREIWYCEKKNSLLACCDDGIRLYDAADGTLLKETVTPEAPLSAIWGGYDPYMFLHEGNQIALLFSRSIDIDVLKQDGVPLLPGAKTFSVSGQETRTRAAFFSPDGKILYLQAHVGDLSAWDVNTGEMLWFREANWSYAPSNMPSSFFSADGAAIWHGSRQGSGYERINPENGETLYVNRVVSGTTLGTLTESPDGAIAVHSTDRGDICAFDTVSGDILWKQDNLSPDFVFSPDGREITFIRHRQDKSTDEESTYLIRVDAATGKSLEDRVLMAGKYAYVDTAFDRDTRKYVLLNESVRTAWVISLPEGTITPYTLPDIIFEDQLTCLPRVSFEGKAVIQWDDVKRDSFLVELKEDGTTGPVVNENSPEGIRLGTRPDEHITFRGQDARLISENTPSGRVRRIESLDSGECLLEIRQGEAFGFTLSPDQESLCVYYSSRPAVLLPLTDSGTLIEQARALVGGDSSARE